MTERGVVRKVTREIGKSPKSISGRDGGRRGLPFPHPAARASRSRLSYIFLCFLKIEMRHLRYAQMLQNKNSVSSNYQP